MADHTTGSTDFSVPMYIAVTIDDDISMEQCCSNDSQTIADVDNDVNSLSENSNHGDRACKKRCSCEQCVDVCEYGFLCCCLLGPRFAMFFAIVVIVLVTELLSEEDGNTSSTFIVFTVIIAVLFLVYCCIVPCNMMKSSEAERNTRLNNFWNFGRRRGRPRGNNADDHTNNDENHITENDLPSYEDCVHDNPVFEDDNISDVTPPPSYEDALTRAQELANQDYLY